MLFELCLFLTLIDMKHKRWNNNSAACVRRVGATRPWCSLSVQGGRLAVRIDRLQVWFTSLVFFFIIKNGFFFIFLFCHQFYYSFKALQCRQYANDAGFAPSRHKRAKVCVFFPFSHSEGFFFVCFCFSLTTLLSLLLLFSHFLDQHEWMLANVFYRVILIFVFHFVCFAWKKNHNSCVWNRRFVCTMVTWRTNGRRSTKNICETNCRAKSVLIWCFFGEMIFVLIFFFWSVCIGCKISQRTTFGRGKSGERSRSTSKNRFVIYISLSILLLMGIVVIQRVSTQQSAARVERRQRCQWRHSY